MNFQSPCLLPFESKATLSTFETTLFIQGTKGGLWGNFVPPTKTGKIFETDINSHFENFQQSLSPPL